MCETKIVMCLGVVGMDFYELLESMARANGAYYEGAVPNGKAVTLKSGVNFFRLPDNGEIQAAKFSCAPDGRPSLVVIHNANYNATLSQMEGVIKGLVITDKVNMIKDYILGSIVVLSTDDAFLGNGGGELIFCYGVLMDLWGDMLTTLNWKEEIT